jgi:hypothetical protein
MNYFKHHLLHHIHITYMIGEALKSFVKLGRLGYFLLMCLLFGSILLNLLNDSTSLLLTYSSGGSFFYFVYFDFLTFFTNDDKGHLKCVNY